MAPVGKSFISNENMVVTKLSSDSVVYDVVIQLCGAFLCQNHLSIKEDIRWSHLCKAETGAQVL